MPQQQGGLGSGLFAIAMTVGRMRGDAATATGAGGARASSGFTLIGLGAATMVPVLFRRAGAQRAMPAAVAIGAMTTLGYAGVLAGPAAMGGLAQLIGLPGAFWMLAGLLALVPALADVVARA